MHDKMTEDFAEWVASEVLGYDVFWDIAFLTNLWLKRSLEYILIFNIFWDGMNMS